MQAPVSPVPADAAVDPTRCPLCGEGNACAAEAERATGEPQPPCWCMATPIPRQVLAQLPSSARGLACICSRCAAGRREI